MYNLKLDTMKKPTALVLMLFASILYCQETAVFYITDGNEDVYEEISKQAEMNRDYLKLG